MAKALNAGYTRYHPKWHRARVPLFWWVRSASYIKFISRELEAGRTQISTHTQYYQVVLASLNILSGEFGFDAYIDHGSFDSWPLAFLAEELGVADRAARPWSTTFGSGQGPTCSPTWWPRPWSRER